MYHFQKFIHNNGCFVVVLLQVKMRGPKHTCGSFNNCGETMASNKWVAERVVDLLREEPEMWPREL